MLSRNQRRLTFIALLVNATLQSSSHAATPAFIWTGTGGTNAIDLNTNWVGPLPSMTTPAPGQPDFVADILTATFGQLTPGATYTVELRPTNPDLASVNTSADYFGGLSGNNDAIIFNPADHGYTFNNSSGFNNFIAVWVPSTTPVSSGNVRNFSPQTQTFNVPIYMRTGVFDAANGDIVLTAGLLPGGNGTASTNYADFQGDHNIFVSGPFLTSVAITGSSSSNRARVFYSGGTTDAAHAGKLILGDVGTTWLGRLVINSAKGGAVRATSNNSFGATNTTLGETFIGDQTTAGGATCNASVEIDGTTVNGNLTIGETFVLQSRTSANGTSHFKNIGGNNTLTGLLKTSVGGTSATNTYIESKVGNLVISGTGTSGIHNTGATDITLNLLGDSTGEISGEVKEDAAGKWNVLKSGTGTWTISAPQSYTGKTTVNGGTLTLSAAGSVASSSTVEVGTNGLLDVSASTPGLVLGSTVPQTLKGDGGITGNVSILSVSGMSVDYNGSAIDSLAISGIFDITGASISFNNLGADLTAGAHVFATYGSLTGALFASVSNLPAGFEIEYHYMGNQIALVSSTLAGDFDSDGDVDGADFIAWQTNFPTPSGASQGQGDSDHDGDVDGADFAAWQSGFPTSPSPGTSPIPEPNSMVMAIVAAGVALLLRGRRTIWNEEINWPCWKRSTATSWHC